MTDHNMALKILSEMKELLASEQFIGKPVQLGENIVMPLFKITFGFGGGQGLIQNEVSNSEEKTGGGGGGGLSIIPVAVMSIANGKTECFAVPQQANSVSTLLEKIPDFLRSFTHHDDSMSEEDHPRDEKNKK